MSESCYSLYGLLIQSPIQLHAPVVQGEPDLVVVEAASQIVPAEPAPGELLCRLEYGPGWGAAHVKTPTGYTLRYYGTAQFELDPQLRNATVIADSSINPSMVPELLLASVPAFRLLMTGTMVLHASVVAAHDKAIAFLAHSGGGKSTLAAAMCGSGFAAITDDLLVIDWCADVPKVRFGSGELRLRPDSAALRASITFGSERVTSDGRTAVSSALAHTDAAPELRVIIVPVIEAAGVRAELRRLAGSESLSAVLEHLRVSGWQDASALRRVFPEQVRLARTVPVYELRLARGPEGLHQAVELLKHLELRRE
ncbi:MAG TPA: hypothetical protein VM240_08140 [Verrucomicrobiae bacterium]|nr:hypothetical protein [Verrucomicrobiae bacterium]